MTHATETLLVLVLLGNLALLGSGRLAAAIRMVALQGAALSLLPLLVHGMGTRPLLTAVGSLALKGVGFPWMLSRALETTQARREIEPYVGPTVSLLSGVLGLAAAFWVGSRLPLPASVSTLVVPTALATLMTGLFLIVSRRQAITQVLGYLVFENGIYVFGVALVREEPLLVEMGILLDLFVAVFVMGIVIFHIQKEFDHIDADRMTSLKDWAP